MKYRIDVVNSRGIFQRSFTVQADSHERAVKEGRVLLERREWEQQHRVLANALPELPADGSCPRCGAQRSACGGPTDPHE